VNIINTMSLIVYLLDICNNIGGIIVIVLTSSAVGRGFDPRSSQTKDYNISICCFSAKQAALMSESKNWLISNKDKVFTWSDMSTHGLLFL
jgi:hypothetical protein